MSDQRFSLILGPKSLDSSPQELKLAEDVISYGLGLKACQKARRWRQALKLYLAMPLHQVPF